MRVALVIAWKDLRQRLKDRSAIVLGFIAPLVIATLMSTAFGSAESFHTTIAVADRDGGPLATAFTDLLQSRDLRGVVTVRRVASEAAARRAVDNGDVGAAYVIPAGFTATAHGGRPVPVTVLADVDHTLDAQVARSIAESFTAQLNADRLSVATAAQTGPAGADPAALAALAGRLRLPAQAVAQQSGGHSLRAISYYGPAMGIFFMLFAIGFGARSFAAERRDGTLDRIAAAPVPSWVVIGGKSLATFVYGLACLTTMAVVTTTVFDARWGPPAAAAALIVAMSLALVALTALVIGATRTERQSDGLAAILTFGLVLLGGNFIFVSAAPPAVRRLALLTPNGWALRGFTDLATGATGAGVVLAPVLAILGFSAVIGGLAAALARRAVVR